MRTRSLRRSKPARPYICRLMSFNRWICPSTWPLLHGSWSAASTALRSRSRRRANVARGECVAASTQCGHSTALRLRTISKKLSLYGRAIPARNNVYRVPSGSDVFEDRLSASARRHARGREAVFSLWVSVRRMALATASLRMLAETSISNIGDVAWPQKTFKGAHFSMRDVDVMHTGFGACKLGRDTSRKT